MHSCVTGLHFLLCLLSWAATCCSWQLLVAVTSSSCISVVNMASKKCSFLTVYKISLLRTRGWFCKLPACYFLDQAFGGHEVELHLPVPWPLSELPHIVPLKELIWLILLTFTRRKFLINFLKSIHTFGRILLYTSTYKYCIHKKKNKMCQTSSLTTRVCYC